MSRRLVGHGPVALAVVAIAATPYLASCSSGPATDGELDVVQICASRTVEPVRLPDAMCDQPGPNRAQWMYASLPPSPMTDVDIDTDAGGQLVAPIYAPVYRGPAANRWSYVAPAVTPGRIGRGVAPMGGTLTRSGAGAGGWNAPGSKIATSSGGLSRQPSPSISRGGLGAGSSGISGAGSGPRGGSSGSSGASSGG